MQQEITHLRPTGQRSPIPIDVQIEKHLMRMPDAVHNENMCYGHCRAPMTRCIIVLGDVQTIQWQGINNGVNGQ